MKFIELNNEYRIIIENTDGQRLRAMLHASFQFIKNLLHTTAAIDECHKDKVEED